HRDHPEAVEPAFGALDPFRRGVDPAAPALEERVAAVASERPTEDGAEDVRSGTDEDDRHVSMEPRPEVRDLPCERAGGERAAVDHRQLARRGQNRGDEHQDEHREQAVVTHERGHAPARLNRNETARSDVPTALVTKTWATYVPPYALVTCGRRPSQETCCAPPWRFAGGRSRIVTPVRVSIRRRTLAGRESVKRTVNRPRETAGTARPFNV